MKKKIYIAKHQDKWKYLIFYSFDEVVEHMTRINYYRQYEFLDIYYPDPETGLVYLRNPTDRAIHRNPEFQPETIEHLDCEYFGQLKNQHNLEIRDTPIPEPYHAYYLSIDFDKCYEVQAFEIDLDKLNFY